MGVNEAKTAILENRTALGIEFGSTRIKAVLVDDKNQPIASGAYEWENQYGWYLDIQPRGDLERSPGQLPGYGRRCSEKIWSGAYKRRCVWCQCHDAWLYAV